MGPLLWGDAPEEHEVVSRAGSRPVIIKRKPVIDIRDPARVRDGRTLRPAYRDQRHVGELSVHLGEPLEIEAAVQRGQERYRGATERRKSKIVEMRVDDVELIDAILKQSQGADVERQGIHQRSVRRAERAIHGGHEFRARCGTAAGEEGDRVAAAN